MSEVARYTFHVNSDKRSAGTSTDMTLNMKNTILLKAVNSKFYIDVHSVDMNSPREKESSLRMNGVLTL